MIVSKEMDGGYKKAFESGINSEELIRKQASEN